MNDMTVDIKADMKVVFIVDDNETNRIVAKTILQWFYSAYALPSSEKMFRLAAKIKPDLILLDIDMPDIDGFQTIKFIRADERLSNVPIIMFSAYAFELAIKECLEAGANGFIAKPYDKDKLLETVAKFI